MQSSNMLWIKPNMEAFVHQHQHSIGVVRKKFPVNNPISLLMASYEVRQYHEGAFYPIHVFVHFMQMLQTWISFMDTVSTNSCLNWQDCKQTYGNVSNGLHKILSLKNACEEHWLQIFGLTFERLVPHTVPSQLCYRDHRLAHIITKTEVSNIRNNGSVKIMFYTRRTDSLFAVKRVRKNVKKPFNS